LAQINDLENDDNDQYSKEAPAELELRNKGVFVNTSLGAGLSYRESNGKTVKDQLTLSIPVAINGEIGLGRNLRIGVIIERNGNRVSAKDSLKIYSIDYGLSTALRFNNTSNSFNYLRTSLGFSDLQVSGVAFYYGNIQDSMVITSHRGVFVNLAVGRQIEIQKGVNFFYQGKVEYANYPELQETNFITQEYRIIPSDNPAKKLRLNYLKFYFELGFAFKI